MHISSYQPNNKCKKDNNYTIAMEEETTDSYYYGMDSLSKEINMIVFLSEYGLKEYNNVQVN